MTRTPSAATLRNALCASANSSPNEAEALLRAVAELDRKAVVALLADWDLWARDDQLPPVMDGAQIWRTWLFLGGRGAGKTRAGAEWVRREIRMRAADASGPLRLALVGQTIADVRNVMVEGESGLLAVSEPDDMPVYEASKTRLIWPHGSVAQFFSAERPEGLRGPQFHLAWCDELVKWRHAEETWDMLQFALRLGTAPQVVVTTTPKPLPLLTNLLEDAATVVTRAATRHNSANLAPAFVTEMQRRYAGTALGRQELEGEIIAEFAGALWRSDWIDANRRTSAPETGRRVVAVDPPVTAHAKSDACGIVVAAQGRADRRGYVLADRTLQGRTPDVWARAVVSAFEEFEADRVVVEVNQGGDLVEEVLRHTAPALPIKKVRATRGKWLRAEPIAALYADGRISHVGTLPELEQQMLAFGANGVPGGRSPDRLDALVWAMTDLMLSTDVRPSIKRI